MARGRAARLLVTQPPLFAIDCLEAEEAARASGRVAIAGVDEVGRGCWAGPVYAAAVVLSDACYVDRSLLAEVTDSKLLTPGQRERLAGDIARHALGAAIGWVEAPMIDRLNIVGATRLAMRAALDCLAGSAASGPPEGDRLWGAYRYAGDGVEPDFLLIDALPLPEVTLPQRAIIRGDRQCLSIAAASIVAKVARDAEMRRRALRYPEYALDENKGYGTRTHVNALRLRGVTPLHRRSFAPVRYFLGLRDHVSGSLPAPA